MRKRQSPIELRVAALGKGKTQLEFTCQAEDFEERHLVAEGFCTPITVTVIAEKSDDNVTVVLKASAGVERLCDRCLAPLSHVVHGSLELIYSYDTSLQDELKDDDYRHLDRNAEYIDLSNDVCDALLLSLPMKMVCTNNPDCHLFETTVSDNEQSPNEEKSEWQASLEKLKSKFS